MSSGQVSRCGAQVDSPLYDEGTLVAYKRKGEGRCLRGGEENEERKRLSLAGKGNEKYKHFENIIGLFKLYQPYAVRERATSGGEEQMIALKR